MTKKLDHFESMIKDKLNQQEFDYNPSDWEQLQSKLHPKKPFYVNPKFYGLAGAIAIILVSGYFVSTNSDKSNLKESTTVSKTNNNLKSDKDINPSYEIKNTPLNNTTKTEFNAKSSIHSNTIDHFVSSDNLNKVNPDNSQQKTNISSTTKSETNSLSEKVSNNLTETNEVNNNVTNLQIDSTTIKENPISTPPIQTIAAFYVNKTEGCLGESFSFNAIEQNDVKYTWNFGDGSSSSDINTMHTYKRPGKYEISLFVTNTKTGVSDKSDVQVISVHPQPSTNFDYEIYIENGIPHTVFTPETQDSSILWSFGDNDESKEVSPSHIYRKKGNYVVSIEVKNEFGCIAQKSQQVYIDKDYNLLAPNSFTPNGDGINDTFIPAALDLVAESFTMTIYGNNGIVYETQNINNPWDGRNQRTGGNCLPGNYMWVVNLLTKDGKSEQYKGAILLLK